MSERIFPIMVGGYRAGDHVRELRNHGQCFLIIGIPWVMIAPHAGQAQRNHSQTLERLAQRGGLSACEALAVLEDREWHRMSGAQANIGLNFRLAEFRDAELAKATGVKVIEVES